MSKFFTAAALSALIATGATAGGMQPVVEMTPVEVHTATGGSSSSNLIVPLIIVALIAAAAS